MSKKIYQRSFQKSLKISLIFKLLQNNNEITKKENKLCDRNEFATVNSVVKQPINRKIEITIFHKVLVFTSEKRSTLRVQF